MTTRQLRATGLDGRDMKAKGYSVRLATPEDVAHLPEIEREAGTLFRDHLDDTSPTNC